MRHARISYLDGRAGASILRADQGAHCDGEVVPFETRILSGLSRLSRPNWRIYVVQEA